MKLLHAAAVVLSLSACSNASQPEKLRATGLWEPNPAAANWTEARTIGAGTPQEGKVYHWFSDARQVGTLTLVPQMVDYTSVQTFYMTRSRNYFSQIMLVAVDCAKGRIGVAAAGRSYYAGHMAQGEVIVTPEDLAHWIMAPPASDRAREQMTYLCTRIGHATPKS